MWRAPVVTTAPAVPALAVARLVSHCRAAEDGFDDVLLAEYLASATGHVEAVTGTRLVTQTVTAACDDWSDLSNGLSLAPVQSVSGIAYVDEDGAPQVLAEAVYVVQPEGLAPSIVLKPGQAWPAREPGSSITVSMVVGYGVTGAAPAAILQALRLLVGEMYAHREPSVTGTISASVALSATVDNLLVNHRKYSA